MYKIVEDILVAKSLNGSDIFLKIIYNKNTREIAGGQIIGKDNAAWRKYNK